MLHELKCWPEQFDQVIWGRKRHEIREYDRSFQLGDELLLREYEPGAQKYTGYECRATITAITLPGTFGMPDGLCCMSIDIRSVHQPHTQFADDCDLTPYVKDIERLREDGTLLAEAMWRRYRSSGGVPCNDVWRDVDEWEQGYWIRLADYVRRIFSYSGEA